MVKLGLVYIDEAKRRAELKQLSKDQLIDMVFAGGRG